jgi:hypothetical protein
MKFYIQAAPRAGPLIAIFGPLCRALRQASADHAHRAPAPDLPAPAINPPLRIARVSVAVRRHRDARHRAPALIG